MVGVRWQGLLRVCHSCTRRPDSQAMDIQAPLTHGKRLQEIYALAARARPSTLVMV